MPSVRGKRVDDSFYRSPRIEKRRGKQYVVIRDKRGRIAAQRRKTKGFTLHKALEYFKENHSLSENVRTQRFTHVVLRSFYGREDINQGRGQYFVEGMTGGIRIIGSSPVFDLENRDLFGINKNKAQRAFLERLDEYFTGGYDPQDGLEILSKLKKGRKIVVRSGIIRYDPITG